jgi:hypothetical protein
MRAITKARVLILLCALVVVFVGATTTAACPNCKDALAANDPEHNSLVKGYFYSILFMMGMPFALVTCFSIYMYRQVLRARAERDARVPSEHVQAERELVGTGVGVDR